MISKAALLTVLHQYLETHDDGQVLDDLEILGVEVRE